MTCQYVQPVLRVESGHGNVYRLSAARSGLSPTTTGDFNGQFSPGRAADSDGREEDLAP